ncbi:MAG: transcription termination/antitermination protein NusA [Cytophagales bacterium]
MFRLTQKNQEKMNNDQLISSIAAFGKSNIDKSQVIEMLGDVLRDLAKKKFGSESTFDVVIDAKTGDLQIWRTRTVVEDDSQDAGENHSITISEARKKEPDFEVGEDFAELLNINMFGRREVLEGVKLFMKKKYELERGRMYEQYKRLIGKIISGQVVHTYPSVILHDSEKNELLLPKSGQIPRERFKIGEYIQAIVKEVEQKNNRVRVILSRSSPEFLEKILKIEIPEILDGIVTIKQVVRIPGVRTKVVVESGDDQVDPAGACIGPGGRRIRTISDEHFNRERIEIVAYTSNTALLVKRIVNVYDSINVEEKNDEIVIYVYNNQLNQVALVHQNLPFISKILNKPARLVEGNANVEESIDDVYLDEFANEISQEIIDALKKIGFQTAKQLLKTSKEAIKEKIGLDQESIDNLYTILATEFA